MTRRRSSLSVTLLACASLLAGCGSGGGASSSTASTSTGSTAASTSVPTGSIPAPSGKIEIAQAITACRRIVVLQPNLSSAEKSRLDGACVQAAKGNTAAAKKAAHELCEALDTCEK